MKILAVYPYLPWPLNRGAYHRAWHLLKGLAAEHEVHLFALAENGEGLEHKDVFREICESIELFPFQHPEWQKLFPGRLLNPLPSTAAHWTNPAVGSELNRVVRDGSYDAVHVLDLVLAQYFLKVHREIPLVLDRTRVDLQYQLMEKRRVSRGLKDRILSAENYLKLWAFEKRVARRCALQVVCGPDDEEFVRRYISRTVPVEVIPNGVDLDYFHPASSRERRAENPAIIFCGAMDYMPNIDALRWYFSEIHDVLKRAVPALEVLIVGKDPIPEVKGYGKAPGVTVIGGVPDVRPYYKRAWLQIVPLRIGGGTRLKIVESLGIGTPVVSTRIGAQGLGLVHDHDILYAESAAEFASETARALESVELRDKLARHGRKSVEERLSWNQLGADLCRAYRRELAPEEHSEVALQPEPAGH